MEAKKEDLMSFNTPDKTGISSEGKGDSFSNESFHEIKDTNAFFQTAKLFDVENRESLMLLKNLDDIDITRNSLGISREFLGLPRESLDFGRESLGILHMNVIDEQLSNSNSISSSINSVLNRGVLYSSTSNNLFSNSSYISVKTPELFNTSDYPEVFSPAQSKQNNPNSLLNAAITNSMNVNDKKIVCKKLIERTQSLNAILELKSTKAIADDKKKLRKCKSLKRNSSSDYDEGNSNFNDSIFMEARILASKIGDSTIFEENGEVGKLDSIAQPEWVKECEEHSTANDLEENNVISENVQSPGNTVDVESDETTKLQHNISVSNQNESQTNCDKTNLTNNSSPNTSKRAETVQSFTKIFQNKSLSTSRISCSSNRSSKDAKEILENLSVILSSENPTSEQKSEGQNLLCSLADILYNSGSISKKESSEDSGRSSIENDQEANIGKPKQGNVHPKPMLEENEKPLDLSTNKEIRGLNRSMSCPNSGERPKNIPQVLKNCQVNIPAKLNNLNKLKPKKVENTKRGPLKAILPLGTMSKVFNRQSKGNSTPPKNEGLSFGNKRTSTPKADSRLCPVAQSTPDDVANKQRRTPESTSQLPKPKFNCPVSPLSRPNMGSKTIQRTLTDSSLSKLKNIPTTSSMSRRKSSEDIKMKPQSIALKRSNSISKDIRPSTTVNTDNNNKNRNSLLEKNRLKNPGMKSLNLISKLRRSAGKENLPQ